MDTETHVAELLKKRGQIAILWDIRDVLTRRPDLTDAQAWEVLEMVEHHHDASIGVSWCEIDLCAVALFGPAPKTAKSRTKKTGTSAKSSIKKSGTIAKAGIKKM